MQYCGVTHVLGCCHIAGDGIFVVGKRLCIEDVLQPHIPMLIVEVNTLLQATTRRTQCKYVGVSSWHGPFPSRPCAVTNEMES
jgi:hypothetical protein